MDERKIVRIINEIIADIEDRSGIGDEWNMIDDGIMEEIKDVWSEIIRDVASEP